jgi:hypothetical protein
MKRISILLILIVLGLVTFACGPSQQEKYVAGVVEDVVGGIPNALYNGNFTGFDDMMSKTRQDNVITFDFDDPTIDTEDVAEGQITITIDTEPQFDNTLELGDDFATPVEDLDINMDTGEVTPVFPAISPFTWDDVNQEPIVDESYFFNLLGIDDPEGADPQDTTIEFDGTGLNDLIGNLNSEVIASGNSIGATMAISIEYTNFRIKEPAEYAMDYTFNGTVSYSFTIAGGIRMTSNFDGASIVDVDISYPDNPDATEPNVNVSGSITPGFRMGWDLNITSTGFVVTPVDGSEDSTMDMDVTVEGNYTMLITATGEYIVEVVGGEPELTVNNFDLTADATDEVSTSGSVTVDGTSVDPSSAKPVGFLMQPIFDIIDQVEENLDSIVDAINNSGR